ncbi:perosamine synthetase [Catenulispora sp. GP43]|uniref:DegT/DnrJ/EryC1/StrS family aminotransferase n=1 Tax=Catenulispora sp. GP43 TaxID=3156263 RepID=UPI00351260CA
MPTSSDGFAASASAPAQADAGALGSPLPPVPPVPRLHPRPDRGGFEPWRRRVRAAVARLAAAPADLTGALQAELLATSTAAGLAHETYRIQAADIGFTAVLTRSQERPGPLPGVVVCPGRNAVAGQVAGAEAPDFPDRAVAARLAEAGFLTLTLDYGFAGSLDPDRLAGRDEAAVLAHQYAAIGRPLLGILARNAAIALRWLEGDGGAQPGRVGLFGHSLGGAVALHAALSLDRPVPVCTASHLGGYRILGYGHPALLLPGIARHADLADLYGALAPAPVQLQYGTLDPELDPADSAAAGAAVAGIYAAAGAGDLVELRELRMGHGTSVADAVGFFERTLGTDDAAGTQKRPTPIAGVRIHFDTAMREEVTDAVDEILDSGMLTLGAKVAEFERELEAWTGGPTVAVDSGSAALEMAMRRIDVAGRVVLTPVNTFYATAAAALRAGADVDFVDLEPEGLGMDPDALAERLSVYGSRVAAVVTVHIGGFVSPALPRIIELCHARGIPVIEDVAHAFGSALDGRRAGSIADHGAFSFYPTKVLTSAEGGAVTASDPEALDVMRRLRDHGRTKPGATTHDCLGSNWRMSEVHAAVGLAQLRVFGERVAQRAAIAERYDAWLAQVGGLRIVPPPPGCSTTWYKYIAELPEDVDRAALKARLRSQHGVALAGEVYDLLLTDQPIFSALRAPGRFPQAERFAARHICLPIYAGLSVGDQERIVAALLKELT